MIVTTTNTIEGKTIKEYKGLVFGEVITGVNLFKDFGASIRDVLGGRSRSYELELIKAREDAIKELKNQAQKLGATHVVGTKIDYEVLGSSSSMMMVIASGTAVVCE